MKKLFFVFLVLSAVFTGCKKDDPAPAADRDKFLGTYTGTTTTTITVDGEIVDVTTEDDTETIDKGSAINKVILSKGTEGELDATVTGSTITIPEQTLSLPIDEETSVECSVIGEGEISSTHVLTMTYYATATYGGSEYEFAIEQTFNKHH